MEYICCNVRTIFNIYANHQFSFWNCPVCSTSYKYTHVLNIVEIESKNVPKVTKYNYLQLYCNWCNKNGIAPISYEILSDIFSFCEDNYDYEATLYALFDIIDKGFRINPMLKLTEDTIKTLNVRLKLRLELFKRIPSTTNMLLAFNLIEELTLKTFTENSKKIDESINKSLERFDKLKALALNNNNIAERKLAFDRCLTIFKKLTNLEV